MIADDIISIYDGRGATAYFGEGVTVAEHCLQAAQFGRRSEASDALVVAALLHDIGHLIETVPDQISDWKTDGRHELVGGNWLASHFGPDVCEPVRLHVAAKRYLCATENDYRDALSAASVVTLGLQGGAMSPNELTAFEAEPYFRDAVLLRRWDDQAKIVGYPTPDFEHFRPLVERLAAKYAAGPRRT